MMWIDSHCHLDAPEFAPDRSAVRRAAREAGVGICVIPAVEKSQFAETQACAAAGGDAFALGIHPLYVPPAQDTDLTYLAAALDKLASEDALVAVGEIGLDLFEEALKTPSMQAKQEDFLQAQLRLAQQHSLPVILHTRRAVDRVLKYLRQHHSHGGIAHAFNGSMVQAKALIDLGFKLGFGGALTYPRAMQLQALAKSLPLECFVLETDSPDIVPEWLYVNAAQRSLGESQARNTPDQLPLIAQALANLRDMELADLQRSLYQNTLAALPKLSAMLASS